MKRMIVPITNSIGISNPTVTNSINKPKNNGMMIGQNNQRRHCSQGFHLGLSVNSVVTSYPNMVYIMPMHIHTSTNIINSNVIITYPLLFVKQAYRHTDLNNCP